MLVIHLGLMPPTVFGLSLIIVMGMKLLYGPFHGSMKNSHKWVDGDIEVNSYPKKFQMSRLYIKWDFFWEGRTLFSVQDGAKHI